MPKRDRLKWSLALFSLLNAPALLSAAGPTPFITSLQSGIFTPTNGAAITAGTPAAISIFINGNFSPSSNFESISWTENNVVTPISIASASATQLAANIPMNLYSAPGVASITVSETAFSQAGPPIIFTSNAVTYTINPAMAPVNALPPGFVGVPYSQAFFTGGTGPFTVIFSELPPPPGLSATAVTGNPLAGTPTQAGTFAVIPLITDSWGNSLFTTESITITVLPLRITTTGLPSGTVGQNYSAAISTLGGVPPFSWSASGLPGGLKINTGTGVISGTPTASGTFSVIVNATDSTGQAAQAAYSLPINGPPLPPVQITTTSLPSGTVGQIYAAVLGATGGSGNYTFAVTSGSTPAGVQFASSGQIYGTPTSPGTFNFTVQATDSSGTTASQSYSIRIAPSTLTITGAPPASVPLNSTVSVRFGATGGAAPYTFTLTGTAPTGTSFTNGTLSGTASAPGTFSFTITAADSQSPPASVSQSYTIAVVPGPLTISASLPAGQTGQPYSGQFSATGGVPPYTWSGAGGDGLSVSAGGGVTGTPTAAATVSLSVTVTDSTGTKTSGTFSVTIGAPALTVTTTSLPNGALTSAYSATLGASGGTPPYTWSATGLPSGLSLSSSGVISGTPTALGSFTVSATVKDSTGLSATASLSLTINPTPLKITTTGISPATLGASFSVGFGATGGTPPYVWTATGLPAGVGIASSGTLSGTPTALGTSSVTVTVTDANHQTASQTVSLVVALPAAPSVNFTGLPATGVAGNQATTPVTFNAPYPVDVTVNLTLTFAPASGADDPNIQFSTGGRTATVTVKSGATASTTSIGVQTGTVAGTITITAQLIASNGTDITPSPAPVRTIAIAAAAPTISSVTATTSSTGFTVTVVGFDPTRAITQMTFTFAPTAGSNLQTTTATVSVQSLFSAWYQSTASTQYGSQFSFTQPFTVTGSVSGIASVTVTVTNPTGASASITATL